MLSKHEKKIYKQLARGCVSLRRLQNMKPWPREDLIRLMKLNGWTFYYGSQCWWQPLSKSLLRIEKNCGLICNPMPLGISGV